MTPILRRIIEVRENRWLFDFPVRALSTVVRGNGFILGRLGAIAVTMGRWGRRASGGSFDYRLLYAGKMRALVLEAWKLALMGRVESAIPDC